MPSLALLPSPFLPLGWDGVAEALRDRGCEARILDTRIPASAVPDDLVARLRAELGPDPVVLVPHSGAGSLVPGLASGTPVSGAVYVDAVVEPTPGRAAIAGPGLIGLIADRVDENGMLPSWPLWWSEDQLRGLYPDAATRARVERDAPPLPLAWLHAQVTVPADGTRIPSAYLAFGDTYAAERDAAEGRGWPVATLPGDHLRMLHDPVGVADAIIDLAAAL